MKDEVINLRVEKDLKEKLQMMAEKDSRKLGDFICVQLRKMVDTSDKKKK